MTDPPPSLLVLSSIPLEKALLEDTARCFPSNFWGADWQLSLWFNTCWVAISCISLRLGCQVYLCLKTYRENNFAVCSSVASHYAEVWQAEFTHWITPQYWLICYDWNGARESLEFTMPHQLLCFLFYFWLGWCN